MTRSMTGFSRQDRSADWGDLAIEIRAVNHRFLEINLRLPEELRALDPQVRKRIGQKLKRGKVDVSVKLSLQRNADESIDLNLDVVKQLARTSEGLMQQINSSPMTQGEILRWPGVLKEPPTNVDAIQKVALLLLERTVDHVVEHRSSEGARLRELLLDRGQQVSALVSLVRKRMPEVRENIRKKLLSRLEELKVNADEGRLETEIALLLNKADVDEEVDRLDGHVAELRKILRSSEPVGRRLDFLMQEFNREANTLGSKSQDAQTTKVAMDLKVLIEQMREQVQNIE